MNALALARRGWSTARGIRRLVRNPATAEAARRQVADEVADRGPRLLRMLDELVWPYPASPARRLLDHAGIEAGDAKGLVDELGVDGALGALRDAGVYVAYEDYHGRQEARRGSATFSF